jgi:hypothetical protein
VMIACLDFTAIPLKMFSGSSKNTWTPYYTELSQTPLLLCWK